MTPQILYAFSEELRCTQYIVFDDLVREDYKPFKVKD